MSFLTYEQTRPWAKAMKVAVLSKKMPPWFADPQYGNFRTDRSLNQSDIDAIVNWADTGAQEGKSRISRAQYSGLKTVGPSNQTIS